MWKKKLKDNRCKSVFNYIFPMVRMARLLDDCPDPVKR